jgi:hypothetical protein
MARKLYEYMSPDTAHIEIMESKDSKELFMSGLFIQGDVQNQNGRVYPSSEIESADEERLSTSVRSANGEARNWLMSSDEGISSTPKVCHVRDITFYFPLYYSQLSLLSYFLTTLLFILTPIQGGANNEGGNLFGGIDALTRRLKSVQTVAFAAAESSALGIGDVFAAVGSAVADDLRELGHDFSAVIGKKDTCKNHDGRVCGCLFVALRRDSL